MACQPLALRAATQFVVLDLVWLTRAVHESRTDDGCRQCEQGLMDIEPPFKSDPQLSEPSKPRMCSLDNPAVFAAVDGFPRLALQFGSESLWPSSRPGSSDSQPLSACNFLGRWRGRPQTF
jgi:hypothetical protein